MDKFTRLRDAIIKRDNIIDDMGWCRERRDQPNCEDCSCDGDVICSLQEKLDKAELELVQALADEPAGPEVSK